MKTSESIAKISAALVQVQGKVHNIAKDETNKHFGNEYATLGKVLNGIREILSESKLAITQSPEKNEAGYYLLTRIVHESGEYFEFDNPLLLSKPDMQGLKSAVTYMRRTSLCALLGIAETDDDAEVAVGRGNSKETYQPPPPARTTQAVIRVPVTKTDPMDNFPPQFDRDQPFPGDLPPEKPEDGGYVIKFGKKYNGQALFQIAPLELKKYADYLVDSSEKSSKPLTGMVKEAVNEIYEYLARNKLIDKKPEVRDTDELPF